jgi:hypothetical protein
MSYLPPSQLRKTGAEQDAAQIKHALTAGEVLPRDLDRDGKSFTQCYRSHTRGGRAVYLKNGWPHSFHVFEISIAEGKETLGEQIAVVPNLDRGIDIALKP